MEKVLDVSLSQIAEDVEFPPSPPPSYPLLSREFFRRHGRDLFSCAASWFLVDIVFYSTNLVQSLINDHFLPPREEVNAYEDAFAVAKFQALVAVCSTIPGYWATVFFIDRIGRVKIQMMGFLVMGLALFASIAAYLHDESKISFLILYGLTFFFSNFGPNTTTFIVPAELFPARFRSTCHGISGAFGKVGAIIGSVGFLSISHKNQEDKNSDASRISMAGALAFLGVVCMLGMIITYLFTRETMGRSLEENEKEDEDEDETRDRCFLRIRRRSNSVREVSLSPA